MRELLEELEAALQSQSPPRTAAFAKPATEDAIRKAERNLDATFPDDLRRFLLCANGQRVNKHGNPIGDFIVPSIRFAPGMWGWSAWGHFVPLREIVEGTRWQYELAELDPDEYDGRKFIGPVRSHYKHIIITRSDDAFCLALDPKPARGGRIGQVVTYNDQPEYTGYLARDLSTFLQMLVNGYREGRFQRDENGTYKEKTKPN